MNNSLLFTQSGRGSLFERGGMGHTAGRRGAVRREQPHKLNITTPMKAPVIEWPINATVFLCCEHNGGW